MRRWVDGIIGVVFTLLWAAMFMGAMVGVVGLSVVVIVAMGGSGHGLVFLRRESRVCVGDADDGSVCDASPIGGRSDVFWRSVLPHRSPVFERKRG